MVFESDTLKERQLELLIALDEARDSVDDETDPMWMFRRIVRVLKEHFKADACAILLIDVQSNEAGAVIAAGMPQDMALSLTKEAVKFKAPQHFSNTTWKHSLGLRIYIDREHKTPGSIVLASDEVAFGESEINLLKLAEGQLDSAVVQARTMWRLEERNRELEAIYQIDRLRDDAIDEQNLLDSFANLLQRHFQADFCQFILSDVDTGEYHTRAMVDKKNLGEQAKNALIEATRDIQTTTSIPAPTSVGEYQLLAAPFIVAGQRLGAVVVGRTRVYAGNDTRLMVAATSQMDSAVAKSRTATELSLRTRELEAIYRIDHIRDRENDFDQMLLAVLQELCHAVSSETGYLMLYNADKQDALEIRAATKEGLVTSEEYLAVIKRISREALDTELAVTYNGLDGAVQSIVALPLILNSQIIGVFGALNSSNPRGFTKDDSRMLSAITSQVDTAVFERLERRRMRQVLSRSVDPKVLDALLTRADDSVLAGERVELTVLFADLRGSTEWAERTDPEEFVSMLNEFLGLMVDVIFKYGGTLDKFVGDEVIALFGSPLPMEDHAYHAAQAALEMQSVHERMRKRLAQQGREIPQMGIGISTGEVIAGEFGPPIRTDFTAMGRIMNLGSRLCSAAEGNQIVISEPMASAIEDKARTRSLESITLKGISTPVQPHELLSLLA